MDRRQFGYRSKLEMTTELFLLAIPVFFMMGWVAMHESETFQAREGV